MFFDKLLIGALSSLLILGAQINNAIAADPTALKPSVTAAPSSFFYTTYQLFESNISWSTCGYDTAGYGCYGSGIIGPFGRACSVAGSSTSVIVADSNPTNGNTVLSFYSQDQSATPTATLLQTVSLPLIPSSTTAKCHMSTLGNFLYFGTSESSYYYRLNLKNYSTTFGSLCGGPTTAITASNAFITISMTDCFAGFDRQGSNLVFGGESNDTFVPGTNGFSLTP